MTPTAVVLGWQAQPAISAAVCERLARGLTILDHRLASSGDRLEPCGVRPDFLFSFCPAILRAPMLRWPRIAAINFHTGPPAWPGRGGCSWAILRGDQEYGVTAHLMVEAIDAGPILRVNPFPIAPDDTAATLHARTLAAIPPLAEDTLRDLEMHAWATALSGHRWAGPAKRQKDLEPELEIQPEDSDAMVGRRIRAFTFPGKPGPYILRAGARFDYRAPA